MKVATGLEVLLESKTSLLAGSRVGVIAHPASIRNNLQHIVSAFYEHPDIRLTAIFGPQHGARGETQDNMIEWEGYRDPHTGLPVYSLYGETRKPTPEMLEEIDTLVFDLQDVGARYYTFIYTMALSMEAAREQGKKVLVLDRPNPLGGAAVEGPVLDPEFSSFVGMYPLPVRHGMTVGELARYFAGEFGLDSDLEVIPMQGWDRGCYFDETGLPWVPPSPNIPRFETTLVYPGLCLLEGTNVSEGRGTTLPFELSGAPWISPERLVAELRSMDLPGVAFRETYFQPTFHKWSEQLVGGVQIYVTDRKSFKPYLTGLALIRLYRELGDAEFNWKEPPYEYEYDLLPFDILSGTDRVRKMLEEGVSLEEMEKGWEAELRESRERTEPYLLY